ncbi:LacI family DNA-binding transcriptional regulator [Aliikangiella coralliicola]|uniref:LacI family transcriptional regulator n=1 Tax=Aliikangiella coralliicola TaxID=2592383 RepID=A0A545UJQ3_9GAMM|nr:LacI family DNA-binding transcriptional regulator [Aliikangiella coralliicola]TQV89687.1 LacI family transcriptional regulator [Aliikangiella coralliicola]
MQKVTINVVAKHAGVSKKTVSRVLNDEPNVSQSTKQKVTDAFNELGYRPSPQARGLATNQSFLIGLVYDNPNKSYVSDIQTGALEICDKNGYHLLIHPTDHESEQSLTGIDSLITESRLDGLVLTPPFSDMKSLLEMLDSRKIAYVRIGATVMESDSLCVISNDVQAAYQMTRYLISLGHVQIGFIKGHIDHNVSEQRFQGYCSALEEAGIEINSDYIQQGDFRFTSGEDCGRRLLGLASPPTAIFASNDYMAAGVLKVASQRRIMIPHELSVVGFDNAPICEYLWPSLTTIKQPVRAMASQAVNILIENIREKGSSHEKRQLDGELIVRESSAPLRV